MQTRQTQRKILSLPGRYFTGSGAPVDVTLSDISVGGCRFKSDSAKLVLGSRLQLYVGGSGPHHATIKWVNKGEVGVTFAHPLSDKQFEDFQNSHVPDTGPCAPDVEFGDLSRALPQRFC